jgi:hypothetical protein
MRRPQRGQRVGTACRTVDEARERRLLVEAIEDFPKRLEVVVVASTAHEDSHPNVSLPFVAIRNANRARIESHADGGNAASRLTPRGMGEPERSGAGLTARALPRGGSWFRR